MSGNELPCGQAFTLVAMTSMELSQLCPEAPSSAAGFPAAAAAVCKTLLLHPHTGRDSHRISKIVNQHHSVKNPQVLQLNFQPKNAAAQGNDRRGCAVFLHTVVTSNVYKQGSASDGRCRSLGAGGLS